MFYENQDFDESTFDAALGRGLCNTNSHIDSSDCITDATDQHFTSFPNTDDPIAHDEHGNGDANKNIHAYTQPFAASDIIGV